MKNLDLFVAIEETVCHSSMTFLRAYAPGGSRLFCLHEKEAWIRIRVIAAITSSGDSVDLLHEGSEGASNFFVFFSSPNSRSGTGFTMDKFAFHKSCVKWDSLRSQEKRTGYSSMVSLR